MKAYHILTSEVAKPQPTEGKPEWTVHIWCEINGTRRHFYGSGSSAKLAHVDVQRKIWDACSEPGDPPAPPMGNSGDGFIEPGGAE